MTLPRLCHQPIEPATCVRCRVLAYWHVGTHLEKPYRTPRVLRWVADAEAVLFAPEEEAHGPAVRE